MADILHACTDRIAWFAFRGQQRRNFNSIGGKKPSYVLIYIYVQRTMCNIFFFISLFRVSTRCLLMVILEHFMFV